MNTQKITLRDVAFIDSTIVNPTLEMYRHLPHVSAEHIISVTGELQGVLTAAEDRMESGKYLFDAGDVLYSKLRPYLRKAVIPEFSGLCSADMYPIKTDSSRLLPAFLRLLLVSDAFTSYANEASARSRMPKLNRAQLFAYEFDCPNIAFQHVAEITIKLQLAAVEEARQAAQTQLSEIRQLKTRVLNEVFASIEGTCPLGKVARIQSGYAFKSESFKKEGVRLLRNANILPGKVYWTNPVFIASDDAGNYPAYSLNAGDVLISLDRPIISTGIKVARVMPSDLPALLVQRVGRFQIDKNRLNPDYLFAFLQTQAFIDTISGHEQSLGVPHISPGQIEAVEIPLPDIETQKRLAVVLTEIAQSAHDAQAAAEAQLQDIELLPSRLLAQVFDTPD